MTTVDRCPITDLDPIGCAHCRGIPDDAVTHARVLGRPFTSAYPGECADCGEPFEAGDRIRSDGPRGYVAHGCEETR